MFQRCIAKSDNFIENKFLIPGVSYSHCKGCGCCPFHQQLVQQTFCFAGQCIQHKCLVSFLGKFSCPLWQKKMVLNNRTSSFCGSMYPSNFWSKYLDKIVMSSLVNCFSWSFDLATLLLAFTFLPSYISFACCVNLKSVVMSIPLDGLK